MDHGFGTIFDCFISVGACLLLSLAYLASLYVWNSPHSRYVVIFSTLIPLFHLTHGSLLRLANYEVWLPAHLLSVSLIAGLHCCHSLTNFRSLDLVVMKVYKTNLRIHIRKGGGGLKYYSDLIRFCMYLLLVFLVFFTSV